MANRNGNIEAPISRDESSCSIAAESNETTVKPAKDERGSSSASNYNPHLKFSRKKSSQLLEEVELRFIPRRTRSTVSRLSDEHDQWGAQELDAKEEHMLVLHDHQLKHSLMDRLNTFRRNRELCDVVLFVKEHEILAHKVVLASISNALFDMFVKEMDLIGGSTTNNTNSNSQNSREGSAVPVENDLNAKKAIVSQSVGGMTTSDKRYSNYFEFEQGDFDCFEAIVNFAYTAKLEISSWKMADLYKTAYCLQVIPIANACARHLAENLSINNCISIRKQANFNNDVFLAGKVDTFITENIEKIISESDEFTQLSCIKVRIITNATELEDGIVLAEKTLEYFQGYPRISDRIDQQIEALVEKSHLLIADNEKNGLQNLCEADDQSSVGSCEIVQDYKRCGQASKTAGHNSNPIGAQQIQHRVTGAKAVKMNASRVMNAQYASNESLNSVASTTSTADDEIESKIIAVYNNSPGFFITIAVLYKRIVALSIQLSENGEVIRSISKDGSGPSSNNGCNGNGAVISSTMSQSVEDIVNNTGAETPKAHRQNPTENNDFDERMVGDISAQQASPQQSQNFNGGGTESASLLQHYRRISLPPMGRARCSNGATFVNGRIVIFGGYDRGECLSSAEEFDVAQEEWSPLPAMIYARGRFDSALESGKIYAIAGSNGNNDLKTCECYDPKAQKWTEVKSLTKARSHNGCTTIEGMIYCVGGSSDQVVLRDCDRYDPKTDEWQSIAPLQTPRFQGGCTSWRGLVIYCAGCDRWNCLDTVEAYDPRTNTWRYLAKLKTPRRGCAIAVMRDALYVIGGHDGTQSMTSVEVLDYPNAQNWRLGPSLNMPRANTHAVVTARSAIYVIGGFNGNQFLDSMEVLENESIGWRSWRQLQNQSSIVEEEDESNTAIENATNNDGERKDIV